MIVLHLLAIYGLVFFLKDSYVFRWPRHFLTSHSDFILELFSCAFCLGTHAGWFVYVLNNFANLQSNEFVTWALAGAAFSLIVEELRNHL